MPLTAPTNRDSKSNAGTSLTTFPTHAVGDIIVIAAFRDGATTPPTKPAASGTVPAWVTIDGPTGTNLCSMIACAFVATATNHTSGTWTNATGIAATVYSGQKAGTGITAIGGHKQAGGANSTGNIDFNLGAVTLQNADGSSIVLRICGARTVTHWGTLAGGWTFQTWLDTEIEIMNKDVTTSEDAAGDTQFNTFSANGGFVVQGIEILADTIHAAQSVAVTYNVQKAVVASVAISYGIKLPPAWTVLGSGIALNTGGAALAVTLTRNQDPNTILVVAARISGGTAWVGCVDSRGGNTYQQDSFFTDAARSTGVYSCSPVNLLRSGDTVTVTFGDSNQNRIVSVYQASRLNLTTWFNKAATVGTASSTAPASGIASLTSGNYELFGFVSYSGASGTYTAGNDGQGDNYTLLDTFNQSGQTFYLATEHVKVSPASALGYKATGTTSVTEIWYQGLVVYNLADTGVTSVSKSLALNYNVSGGVLKSSAFSYKLIATISKTSPLNYNVRRQVAKTIAPTYAVVQSISKTLAVSYSVQGKIGQSVILVYRVNPPVWTLLGSGSSVGTANFNVVLSRAQDPNTVVVVVSRSNDVYFSSFSDTRGGAYQTDLSAGDGTRSLVVGSRGPGSTRLQSGDTVTVAYGGPTSVARSVAVYQVTNLNQVTWFNAKSSITGSSPSTITPAVALPVGKNFELFGVAAVNVAGFSPGLDGQNDQYVLLDNAIGTSNFYLATEHIMVNPTSGLATLPYTAAGSMGSSQPWVQGLITYVVSPPAVLKSVTPQYNVKATVVKSRAFNYNVQKTVAKTSASTYTVKQTISKTLAFSYDVIQFGTVIKSLTASYKVIGRISKTVAPNYFIRLQVAKAIAPSYKVIGRISKAQPLSYNVATRTAKSLAFAYKVTTAVGKSFVYNYTVKKSIARATALSYFVTGGIVKSLALNYKVPGRVAVKSLALAYTVRAFVALKTVTPSYLVRKAIVQAVSPAYRVRAFVFKTTPVNYALHGMVSKTVTAAYKVRAFIGKPFVLNYKIRVQTAKSLVPTYFIARRVAVTSIQTTYNVRPPAVKASLAVSYFTLGGIHVSLPLAYNVQRQLAKSRAFSYTVKLKAVKTVSPSYTVRATISKSLTFSYRLRFTILKSRVVSYWLINTFSVSRNFTYTVRTLVAKKLAPSYVVAQPVSRSLGVSYRLRRQLTKPLVASYAVRVAVGKALGVSYRLRVVLAKPPRFTYNVRRQITATVPISFRLHVARAKPLSLTYKLQAQIRRSVPISYGVSGHMSAHLALAYKIRTDILIPGDDPVSAKFQAVLLSTKIPSWAS